MNAVLEEDAAPDFDPEEMLRSHLEETPDTFDLEQYLKDEETFPTDTVRTVQASRLISATARTLNERLLLHPHALHSVRHASMVIGEIAETLGVLRETAILLMAWVGAAAGRGETANVGNTFRALAALADNIDDVKRLTASIPIPEDLAPKITAQWLAENVTAQLRYRGIAAADAQIYDEHIDWDLPGGVVLTVGDSDTGAWELFRKVDEHNAMGVSGNNLPTAMYAHPAVVAEAVAQWHAQRTPVTG